jgi:hypothetical protein
MYQNGAIFNQGQVAVPNTLFRQYSYVARSEWSGDAAFDGDLDVRKRRVTRPNSNSNGATSEPQRTSASTARR